MSRYKGKDTIGTPEVNSARSKLDGVLRTLVDKKDDSPPPEQVVKEEADSFSDAVTPPHKTTVNRQSRKRKRSREESSSDLTQYHHTYMMRLFDRSVDLAQFDENSSLYPICRAWIQPHNHSIMTNDPQCKTGASDDEDDELHSVNKLPSPAMLSRDDGSYVDLRIPSPIAMSDKQLDISLDDPSSAPSRLQLLDNHMDRWKATRHKWKEAARKNEARYADSLTMLKDMFDGQCKDQ